MYASPQATCVIGFDIQSSPTLAIFPAGSACAMPYAPELGFSADGSQSDSCCQSASRQENCAAPICASAYDRASSTVGVGAGAGAGAGPAGAGAGATGAAAAAGVAFCVVELDPRSVPSEREIGAARAPTVSSSPWVVVALVLELATAVVDAAATVDATASERGVAGAKSMRAAMMAVSAAVAIDVIE